MTEKQPISQRWHYLWPVVLVLAGVAVYANSFYGIFLFDDEPHILRNETIQHLFPPWDLLTARRPVVYITLAINYAISQLEPWSYHALNLIVHILASLTLYGVVRQTLSLKSLHKKYGRSSNPLAGVMALIWLVHPLQTQSVTYIVQRGESLMGLFYLFTLYSLIRSSQSNKPLIWWLMGIASCVMGMGSKAVMVTAPVMMLLYDRIFLCQSIRDVLRQRKTFYAGLASTWTILWMSGIVQGVFNTTPTDSHVGFSYQGITSLEYLATQPGVLLHYLSLCYWPQSLCLDYAWPVAKTTMEIALPGIVIMALFIITIWGCFIKPKIGFVGAWFFMILSPTSSFIPIKDAAFEHRMYLPLASVIILTVLIVNHYLHKWKSAASNQTPVHRNVSVMILVCVVILLGMGTIRRNRIYHSNQAMWQDVLKNHPHNYRAYTGVGVQLFYEGKLDEAIQSYQKALQIKPEYADGHYNLGVAFAKQNKIKQAISSYQQAINLNPKHVDAHSALGWLFMNNNQPKMGVRVFEHAVDVVPDNSKARLNLGNALGQAGRMHEAIEQFQKALELQPDSASGYYGLGMAYLFLDRIDEAVHALNEALQIQPDHKRAGQALQDIQATKNPE